MTAHRPLATVSLPAAVDDPADFTARLSEVIAGVLGDIELPPVSLRVAAAADDRFSLAVGGRPAVVGLSPAADSDAMLDEISLRLLRRLELWEPYPGPLRGVTHYLAHLGMRPRGIVETEENLIVAGEREMDDAPDEIVLEVPVEVARQASQQDIDAMVLLRREVFHRSGIEFPDVRVRLTEPRLRRIRIGLNSTFVTVRTVPPGSGWGYVVRCLERALEGRLHWFVRRTQVERSLDKLRFVVPDLVDSCRRCYPSEVLTACLRELVRHGQSLRNLSRIMWLLLDLGSTESGADHFLMAETPLPRPGREPAASTDPVALASRVRKCMNEEAWRTGALEPSGRAGRLSSAVEAGLVGAIDPEDIAQWEWAAVGEFAALGRPAVLVVGSIEAIAPAFDAMRCLADRPEVIASAELPPDAVLSAIPVAGEEL